MIVHVTDLALVERIWPALEPLFAKVTKLTNGCYEPPDVLTDIQAGKQQLWVSASADGTRIDAAMTTLFDYYPRRKTLKVVFVAGAKMRTWLPEFRDCVEAYARANGATMLEGFFRQGWARVWPGARISGVGLVKEL